MAFHEQLYEEAKQFLVTCYGELGKNIDETDRRLADIKTSIETYGTYEHTYEELVHGAKMAWRNSNRCIGRLFWQTLEVFDARALQTEGDIAEAVFRHIDYATNQGKIRPSITVFKSETNSTQVRIWNHQLIRYAGYETGHGTIGDSASLRFTAACRNLGWKGRGTQFDVLPLVIQVGERTPKWYTIPDELIMEIPIRHPDFAWFDDLSVKWYAVPFISDMLLEIGGIRYPAAPFNGWYMETEIGARNLADTERYNMLPQIASLMGLNTTSNTSLWKDKALVELNIAVLHSFRTEGVSIVDHHTAAEQFKLFEQLEHDNGRSVTGNWGWLIPPVSPATTHIFHKRYDNFTVKPNYFRQECPY